MRRLCLFLGLLAFGCTGSDLTGPSAAQPTTGRYSLALRDSASHVSTGTLTIAGPAGATAFAVTITSSDITVQPSMASVAGGPWFVFATVGSAQVPVRLALTWSGTNVTCIARNNVTLRLFGACALTFQGS